MFFDLFKDLLSVAEPTADSRLCPEYNSCWNYKKTHLKGVIGPEQWTAQAIQNRNACYIVSDSRIHTPETAA